MTLQPAWVHVDDRPVKVPAVGCVTTMSVEMRSTPIWLCTSTGRTRTLYVPAGITGVV